MVPRPDLDHVHEVSRRLRSRCEAIYGAVFRSPEWPDGGHGLDGVQWYMAGRCGALGPVGAPVATAILGSFDPRRVHAGLDGVWSRIAPDEVLERRTSAAVDVLRRTWSADPGALDTAVRVLARGVSAAEEAGHPLFAALSARPRSADPVTQLWQLCELVREHRGAAHVNAWRAAGLDAVEVNVLNELWRDVPTGSIAHVDMGWGAADIADAMDRLVAAGLAAGGGITPAGRDLREGIERATGAQQASIVDALGGDAATLLDLVGPWAGATATGELR